MKSYLSYKDDDENESTISGYFEIIKVTDNFVKFKTKNGQLISISWNRVLKFKENKDE